VPFYSFEGQIKHDIAYGEDQKQNLDIYLPKTSTAKSPVVIFFHGGSWNTGNKDQYQFVGKTLANLGYIVVIPNTRLYPQVKFPTFIQDTAKAIAWVYHNIDQYGGSSDIFLTGHSSGAHMGALAIADGSYLKAYDLSPSIIKAFAGMSGPYDFEPESKKLKEIFGPPPQYPKMAVTNFIDGDEPPMLLIYTQEDKTVHPRNLEKLEAGIRKAKGQVETLIYPTGGHSAPVSAFSWLNPPKLAVPQDIDRFFKAQLTQ
jgi:acetyl esterase/lipase